MLHETSGWTEIFIYPGYQFKVIDALITNFHLPESTLVMLVSALAGREHVLHAYEIAVQELSLIHIWTRHEPERGERNGEGRNELRRDLAIFL